MKHCFCIIILLLLTQAISAQVVNVERLRLDSRKPGWSGSVAGNIDLQRNQRSVFNLGTNANVQYRQDSNLFLFVNQAGLIKASGANLVNFAFGHFRYTRQIMPQLAIEGFTQLQQNRVNGIQNRWLLGGGVRTRIFDLPGGTGFFGFLVMREREVEIVDSIPTHRDIRASFYLAGSYTPESAPWITAATTTYFQPRIGRIEDIRISTEWNVQIRLRDDLALTTIFELVYDSRPPVGLENTFYNLRNGLKFTFQ